ncbi:MAG TPA: DMT family transporter [Candidatus Acidoferrales bacterium]|nr:DMT family transporter [Candidatus Acidoferrales bacterium]
MGVFLGLAAAFNWGTADFMARFATRRIGALRALLFMQLFGFLALTAVMAASGHWSSFFPAFRWSIWAWIVLAGVLSVLGALALYRSFEIGVLALVSPIASSYPALTVLLSISTGERLTRAHAFGVAAVIVGVIVAALVPPAPSNTSVEVSVDSEHVSTEHHRAHLLRGVPWAITAALIFGVNYWILGFRVMPVFGGFASVWVIRLISFLVLALLLRPLGQSAAIPKPSTLLLIFFIGVTDTAGFVCNNLAFKQAEIAIATVLSSLYGVVTVLFAALFLRERLGRRQWVGVALIFAGVVLISM